MKAYFFHKEFDQYILILNLKNLIAVVEMIIQMVGGMTGIVLESETGNLKEAISGKKSNFYS